MLRKMEGKGKYAKIAWDENQTQLAFLSDRDDSAARQPKWKLYRWLCEEHDRLRQWSTIPAFQVGRALSGPCLVHEALWLRVPR